MADNKGRRPLFDMDGKTTGQLIVERTFKTHEEAKEWLDEVEALLARLRRKPEASERHYWTIAGGE